jgi:sugar lactone lactonase YvrE
MSINANTVNVTTGSFKNLTTSTVSGTGIAKPSDVTTGTNKVMIVTPASLATLFDAVGTLGSNSAASATFGSVTASTINGQILADTKTILTGTNNTKGINPAGIRTALTAPPPIGGTKANAGQFLGITASSINSSSNALAQLTDVDGSRSGVITPSYSWTVAGAASLQTSTKEFGSASLALLNSGDYAQLTINPPTSQWTIEFWFYANDYGGVNTLVGNSVEFLIALQYDASTQTVSSFLSSDGQTWDISLFDSTETTALPTTWNHCAIQYNGFQYSIYLNGTRNNIASLSAGRLNVAAWSTLRFGDWGWSSDYMNGYIDELRISNIARYDASFTPQTTEFVRDLNTLVLNHFNGSNGSTNLNATEDKATLGYSGSKVITPFSFINMLLSPPQIGSVNPNTATFTDVSISGSLNLTNPLTTRQGAFGRTSYSKGDLFVGAGGSNLNILPAGTSNKYLRSDSHSTYGLEWQPASQSIITTVKPLFASNADSVNASVTDRALPPSVIPYVMARPYSIGNTSPASGTFGTITVLNGVSLASALTVPQGGTGFTTFSTGDLLIGNSNNNLSKLPAGSYGQYLKTDTTKPLGISWATTSTSSSSGATSFANYSYISAPKKLSATSWSFDTIFQTDDQGATLNTTSLAFDASPTNVGQINGIVQSASLAGSLSLDRTDPYTVTGTGTQFTTKFQVGDIIYVSGFNQGRIITAINSDTSLQIDAPFTNSSSYNTWTSKLTANQPYVSGLDCIRHNNPKWGLASAYTNGNDLQFQVTMNPSILTNTPNAWTYELWYTHNTGANINMFFQIPGYAHIGRYSGYSTDLVYNIWNGNGVALINPGNINPNVATSGQYLHMALCYNSSTFALYLNGTQVWVSASGQPNFPPSALQSVVFGGILSNQSESVYIDEFRFSNICRYTGTTYQVPTDRFTWDTNTISLQHFENLDFNLSEEANFMNVSGVAYQRGGYASNARYHLYSYVELPSLILSTRNAKLGASVDDLPSALNGLTRIQLPYQVDISSDIITVVATSHDYPTDHIDIGCPKMLNKFQYLIPYTSARNATNTNNLVIKGSKTLDPQKIGPFGVASGLISGYLRNTSGTTVTGLNTNFTSDLRLGDILTINGQSRTVSSITNDTTLTVNAAYTVLPSWTGKDNATVSSLSTPSNSKALYVSNNAIYNSVGTFYVQGLSAPSSAWTIELWCYPILDGASNYGLLCDWITISGLSAYIRPDLKLQFKLNTTNNTNASGGSFENSTTTVNTLNNNAWNHIALQYDGTTYRAVVNGDLNNSTTFTSSQPILSTIWNNLQFGYADCNTGFEGYIDSIRISNVARYTQSATPPSTFTVDANTLSLNTFDSSTALTTSEQISGVTWSDNTPVYSTVQSRFGNSSAYFKGSSNSGLGTSAHMYTNINGLKAPTETWTMELWFNINSVHRDYNCLIGNYSDNITKIGVNNSGNLIVYLTAGTGALTNTGSTNIQTGTWYHLALVFTGISYDIYLNGNLELTFASELPIDPKTFHQLILGRVTGNTAWYFMDGYIDEFRCSNIARYTAAFSPPTAPFTRDANTILLNHFDQNGSASDFNSTEDTNFISTTSAVTNFTPTYSWSAYNGASISRLNCRFGISSLYLTRAQGSYAQISNGPNTPASWTLGFWVSPLDLSTNMHLIVDSTGLLDISLTTNGYVSVSVGTTAAGDIFSAQLSSNTITANSWSHVALVFNAGTYNLFVNGTKTVLAISVSNLGPSTMNRLNLGSNFNGYMDEFRLTSDVRYSTTFVPKDSPSLRDSNTLILNHFNAEVTDLNRSEDRVIQTDKSTVQNPPTWTSFGNASISNAAYMFGSGSLLCDRTNISYARVSGLPTTNVEDFSMEVWVYLRDVSATYSTIFAANANYIFQLVVDHVNSNKLSLFVGNGISWSQSNGVLSTNALTVDTWTHIAVTFSMGEGWRVYFNGTANQATGRVFAIPMSTINIGSNFVYTSDATKNWNGFFDEFRYSNMTRYTTTQFCPQTAPYVRDNNTLSLAHFDTDISEDTLIVGKITPTWTLLGNRPLVTTAKYMTPSDVVLDSVGNIYVADAQNGVIRKIDPTNGFTSTVSTAVLSNPTGLTIDPASDTIYVSETGGHCIWKMPTTPNSVMTRIAGSGTAAATNTGSVAIVGGVQFSNIMDGAYDSAGSLYVSDFNNNSIRKIDPVTGIVTTFASGLNSPTGLCFDSSGNLYFAEWNTNRIRKITPNGLITTFAGGTAGFQNGFGGAAQFTNPVGLAIDGSDNIYVCDSNNNRIRKIDPSSNVTTVAGSGTNTSIDGTGTSASFNAPFYCALDTNGNLFVSDYHGNVIRKVTPAGVVTTFAGSGTASSTDGTGTAATFNGPRGIKVDSSGNLYVCEFDGQKIRKITASAVTSTIAGSGTAGSTNATGTAATFNNPVGLVLDAAMNIYVMDSSNYVIRKITTSKVVTTAAGSAGTSGSVNNEASFNSPGGLAFDPSTGLIFVCDTGNNKIRSINAFPPRGVSSWSNFGVSTPTTFNYVGTTAYPPYTRLDRAVGSSLRATSSITFNIQTNGGFTAICYVRFWGSVGNSECIFDFGNGQQNNNVTFYRSASTQQLYARIFAGTGGDTQLISASNLIIQGEWAAFAMRYRISDGTMSIFKNGTMTDNITGVATYANRTLTSNNVGHSNWSGNASSNIDVAYLYAYDSALDDNTIASYTASTTVPTGSPIVSLDARSIVMTPGSMSPVATYAGSGTAASTDGNGTIAAFNGPAYCGLDKFGNLYVTEGSGNKIRKIASGNVAAVTTIAGSGTASSVNGTGIAATFNSPRGIQVDSSGNFYISDRNGNRIRKMDPSYVVTTYAGSGLSGQTDATGTAASFANPMGLCIDRSGNLIIADSANNKIRKIDTNVAVTTFSGPLSGYVAGYVDVPNPTTALQTSIKKFDAGALYVSGGITCPMLANIGVSTLQPWTIEFWFYPTGTRFNTQYIFNATTYSRTSGILIGLNSTNNVYVRLGTGTSMSTSWDIATNTSSNQFASNAWNHFALVYNTTSYQMYLNGIRTQAGSSNPVHYESFKAIKLGYWEGAQGTANAYTGYIDELRISNIARYGLTHVGCPSGPFLNDSYTSALNHFNCVGSPDLSDSEYLGQFPNEIATWSSLPLNVNPSKLPVLSSTQKKFGLSSLSFNGTDQCAVINKDWNNFAVNTWWTVEFWAYLSSTMNGQYVLSTDVFDTSAAAQLAIKITASQLQLYIGSSFATANGVLSSNSYTNQAWNHIALCYTYNGWWVYLNGVGTQLATATTAISKNPFVLGYYNSNYFSGFIDELRISRICRYFGNFTPQTSEFTTDVYTIVLNHFNGSDGVTALTAREDISDQIIFSQPNYGAQGASSMSTTRKMFGSSSAHFTSANDAIAIGGLYHPSAPWTIEGWLFVKKFSTSASFLGALEAVDNAALNRLIFNQSSIAINLNSGTGNFINATPSHAGIHTGTWHHVVLQYDGLDNFSVFVNGQMVMTSTTTSSRLTRSAFTTMSFGSSNAYTNTLNGYLDEIRISNSRRYRCNGFVPSNMAFIKDTATLSLNHCDGAGDSLFSAQPDAAGISYNSPPLLKIGSPVSTLFNASTYSLVAGNTNILLSGITNSKSMTPTTWTIELWVFLQGFYSLNIVNTPIYASTGLQICARYSSGNLTLITPDGTVTIGSRAIPFFQWAHVAVTYDGTIYNGYVNGQLALTYTSTNATNIFNTIYVGWKASLSSIGSNRNVPMYVSNFRISKTVRYTGNFTVPAAAFNADASTLSLQTFGSATFVNGEIGLGIPLYRGGFYYNKIYSVYIVGHNTGLAPIYIMSDRNVAYGDVLLDLPAGYNNSNNIRQLPFYIATEDLTTAELAVKQYYFMKNVCITAVTNRLSITSSNTTAYTNIHSNFASYIPPNIKRCKVGLQISDFTPGGTVVRLTDDNNETNFVEVTSIAPGTISFQYVDAPCYAGVCQAKLADTTVPTTMSLAVAGFYLDDAQ